MTTTPSTPITSHPATIRDTVVAANAALSNGIAFVQMNTIPHEGLNTARLALREWLDKADLLDAAGQVDWQYLTDASDAIRHWLIVAPLDINKSSHRLAVEKAAETMGYLKTATLRAMDIA